MRICWRSRACCTSRLRAMMAVADDCPAVASTRRSLPAVEGRSWEIVFVVSCVRRLDYIPSGCARVRVVVGRPRNTNCSDDRTEWQIRKEKVRVDFFVSFIFVSSHSRPFFSEIYGRPAGAPTGYLAGRACDVRVPAQRTVSVGRPVTAPPLPRAIPPGRRGRGRGRGQEVGHGRGRVQEGGRG